MKIVLSVALFPIYVNYFTISQLSSYLKKFQVHIFN